MTATDEQQRCREALEKWHASPNRLPLEQPNGGDAPTGFYAGYHAAYAAQEQRIKGLAETLGAIGSNSGPKTLDGKELYQLGTAAAMCRQALAQYHAGQKAPASTEDENG